MWSGLGYYRRARQLHAAAKKVVQEFGDFPSSIDDILSLPGIGRYTAGAIASFAFDQPAPIVEANTQRLFARLIKLEEDPRTQGIAAKALAVRGIAVPAKGKRGAGRINQAAIELGSQVCTPREPACHACPISLCPTFADGLQNRIPVAAPKLITTELEHIALVIERPGQYLLRQNPADQWWHGLWDFPRLDVTHLLQVSKQNVLDHRELLAVEMARTYELNGTITTSI